MDRLTKLYQKIEEDGIFLFNTSIPNYKAATLLYEDQYGIFVDYARIDSLRDELSYVAHEYGHCKSGTTHSLLPPLETVSRYEHRANKRAVLEVLPIEDIRSAISDGCREVWEFCEYLDVSQSFFEKAVEIYREMNLI